jgi:hypothetical protein
MIVACEKKEDKPATPVVPPIVEPEPPKPPKDEAVCKAEGKSFQCGTNAWWNFECGGNPEQETVYFASTEEIVKAHGEKNIGACIRVTYKNGEQVMLPVVGAGPCLPCGEM